ncbi:SlyX protein [Maridesulfovibrio ferrireducens]|uniref:SlyX protein n=1 Tax=Maridesulfovibrio ferrireducens TaxID=246191 RepID=A0A1G9L6F0_9BACT|nr:SlyX family protein [Maridesulfovibrio ferrireducens]SDL57559.1 SlyX protein [Maridesulfovibrio ferrireducens]
MNTPNKLEDRIETLETSLAMQDRIIEDMNVFIIAQQNQISELEKKIDILAGQMKDLKDIASASGNVEDVPPPHYS